MYSILFAVAGIALLASVARDVRRMADAMADRPDREEGTHELLIKLNRSVTEMNGLLRRTLGDEGEGARQVKDSGHGTIEENAI